MLRIASLAVLILSAIALGQPAKYADALKSLETVIERERVDAGIPGISIAVVEDQTVMWSKGFGHADLAKTRLATTGTVYRVGSVSKLLTDIAIMQLVEEGKVELDAPVTKYLPSFNPANQFDKPITLRQLMSHRSGLMREPPVGSYFDPEPPTLAKTVANLNGLPLIYEPGTRTKYSNAAIAVVGLVLETVDGRPFATAVRERVLTPVGMSASDFEPTPTIKKALAEGQMWTFHGREFPAPKFELGESPAGCMYSTTTDLAKFMSAVFANGKGLGLQPNSLKEMLKPQFEKADANTGFGLGFMIGELHNQSRIGHGGAIYGFSTEVAMLPNEKLGVVLIANKDVVNGTMTRLANKVLRNLLAARNEIIPPLDAGSKSVPRDLARKLAGKYGDGPTHELFELGGKLFHVPAKGGFISEMRMTSGDGGVSGRIHNGNEFTCDGTILHFDLPKEKAHRRIAELGAAPPEPPEDFKGLIGEYGWDHNTVFIFEKDNKLHALIEWFFLYPLEQESKDVYKFPAEGGLYHGERLVFKRDAALKATEVTAAGVVFKRRQLDGEDGRTFRITPLKPVDELRKLAAESNPPFEEGLYKRSTLVELATLDQTFKFDLRYASDNNFLGTPLYPKSAKAYMQRPAAEALARHE